MTTMEAANTSHWGSPNQARFRQRDQVLVRLAEKLLKSQGLVSFRFSELAPLAGCSAGTLYKHFCSKEDLLIAIFSRHIEHLIERQPNLMNCQLSYAERWLAMHLFAVMAARRSSWTLALNSLCSAPKVLEQASDYRVQDLKMHLEQFYGSISRVIEGARIQGELNANDHQITMVHSMLSYLERGAMGIQDNPLMQTAVKPLELRQLFDAFSVYINSLDWQQPLKPDSFQRIVAEIELQLDECDQELELLEGL